MINKECVFCRNPAFANTDFTKTMRAKVSGTDNEVLFFHSDCYETFKNGPSKAEIQFIIDQQNGKGFLK